MKVGQLLKRMLFGLAVLMVWPFWLVTRLERALGISEEVFLFCGQCLAIMPGLPGAYLRGAYYFGSLEHCDWEVRIGFGSIFVKRAARIGKHASFGNYCVVGHADIGQAVMVGSRVSIPSGKRQHLDEAGRLSGSQGQFDRVTIGARSWIGEGAIVLADVGEDCIVGAGAVVSHAVPVRSLVSGNPARVVRSVDVGATEDRQSEHVSEAP
jgi:acetyltransferase-like isoleucine patch superfamily enzyme